MFDGVEFAQAVLHRIGQVAILPGQYQEVVLLLLVIEEVLQFTGRDLAIGFDDDEHPWATEFQFIQLWKNMNFLIGVTTHWLQNAGETIDQRLIDLGLWYLLGVALDLAREVLGLLDEKALFLAVEVPGLFTQSLQGLEKFVRFTVRRCQELDDFTFG